MNNNLMKLTLNVPSIVLSCVLAVEAKYCLVLENGETKHFSCGPFQHCCGASCCESFGPFYRLWYFWLCVMLALLFCSFGGYWYRRHYFQHRLLASQNMPGQSTVMMFMMNNIQTNNHFDFGDSDFHHPNRRQCVSDLGFTRPHQVTSPRLGSANVNPPTSCYQMPAAGLSTPPPSYYETVYMPPPPEYGNYNRHDVAAPRADDLPRYTSSGGHVTN